NVAFEAQVLERVIFGADGQVVRTGSHRDPLRDCPRPQRAVMFEAQVPVERASVVLLDDEPCLVGSVVAEGGVGLGRAGEVPLGPIRGESFAGHASTGSPGQSGRGSRRRRALPAGLRGIASTITSWRGSSGARRRVRANPRRSSRLGGGVLRATT